MPLDATIPHPPVAVTTDRADAPDRGRAGRRAMIGIIVIAALGTAAAVVMTRWGTGLSTDSMTYLRAAAMFEQGFGLIEPGPAGELASPHFPPLYPLTISVLTMGDVALRSTARWLNVVLVAVNVMLIAALAWRATGRAGAAIVAAALFAASNTLLELHVWAWSEPLFLAWMMTSLLLLSKGLSSGSWRLLLPAAVAAAAAALTRYAGVAVIAAWALSVLLLGPWTLRRRWVHSVIFGAVAATPLALWLLRNRHLRETTVNRGMQLLGFDHHDFEMIVATLLRWLFPPPLGLHMNTSVLTVVVCLIVMAWVTIVVRRRARGANAAEGLPAEERPPAVTLRLILCILVPCYIALVLLVIGLLDATTPLDGRILAPVQIALIIGVAFVGARIARVWSGRRPIGPWLAWGSVLVVAIHVWGTVEFGRQAAGRGLGLASSRWAESHVLGQAKKLPPTSAIYTNMPELIEVYLGRPAVILPRPFNTSTRTPIESYEPRMRRIARALRSTDSVVIWFDRTSRNDQYENEERVMRKLGVVRISRGSDGAIYRHVPGRKPPSLAKLRRINAAKAEAARRAAESEKP